MSYLSKKSVEDLDVAGKRVLVRCDFNVPLKAGVITDENRIVAALPTIQYLIDHNAKVILCSHLGKPKGEPKPELSLAPVAVRLAEKLGRPVVFAADDNVVGANAKKAVAEMKDGDVVLFRCCGRHILHRIVRRDGERLTLAGDGNYRITEQCTTRDVAGIAVRVIRASGRVVSCDSPGWQLRSRLWLAIPPWLRRQVLRVLWHSGWK